jgi:hypothetical protein
MRGRFFSFQRLAGEFGGAMSPTMFSILSAISYATAFGFVGMCGVIVASIIGFKVKDVVGRVSRRGEAAAERVTPPAEPVAAATETAPSPPPAQPGS